MLGYASEEKLKAVLIAVGDGERDLEAARQRLCSIRDFALHSAFERLDRDASNWVGSKELVNFLRDNAVVHVSDGEAYDLVKFFDSDGNGKLSFQEFIQMLLPCEDNVLRNMKMSQVLEVGAVVVGLQVDHVHFVLEHLNHGGLLIELLGGFIV